jgi:hypothetical protein
MNASTIYGSGICSAKYSNAHKTKGSKISKLELLLQSKLPIMYPSLDFRFNKTDAINRELDIYIPALKLAIEINGIFHYEPIFGIKKLINTQNSDKLKLSSCLDKNIELHIIDVSKLLHFNESGAAKYIEMVKSIIDTKLSKENHTQAA